MLKSAGEVLGIGSPPLAGTADTSTLHVDKGARRSAAKLAVVGWLLGASSIAALPTHASSCSARPCIGAPVRGLRLQAGQGAGVDLLGRALEQLAAGLDLGGLGRRGTGRRLGGLLLGELQARLQRQRHAGMDHPAGPCWSALPNGRLSNCKHPQGEPPHQADVLRKGAADGRRRQLDGCGCGGGGCLVDGHLGGAAGGQQRQAGTAASEGVSSHGEV